VVAALRQVIGDFGVDARQVIGVDDAFIQALVQDNPWATEDYIESLRNTKDRVTKERLYFGNWEYDNDPTALYLLTFCVLTLRNGFTVTGESACASPENFDVQIGRAIARENAVQKIWPLLGYELRTKLAAGEG
jgi:hypothetical protein